MSDSIISEFNWEEGVAIPVANDENKQLENELLATKKEIAELSNEATTNEERVNDMKLHLQNVNYELLRTMALIDAHKTDLQTEEHMIAIAQREDGRLKQETARVDKDLLTLQEQHHSYENKIFLDSQQLENLKSQMGWDQDTLEAWLEESARRDEDAITLEKYSQQDDSKIKELGLLLEHLTEKAQQKCKFLNTEMSETLIAQIALDKTAEDFRAAHAARLELIKHWEGTLEQMQKRDREMDGSAAALTKIKEEIRTREQIIAKKEMFLANESENNKELEKKIASQERQAAKLRLEYQDHEVARTQYEDALETLKYTVERTATDLESTKGTVIGLNREIVTNSSKLQDATKTRERMDAKFFIANQSVFSSEEQAKLASGILDDEERQLKELDKDLCRIRDVHYKKKLEEQAVITQFKDLVSALQANRAADKNLASRLDKLNQESIKQQEIIYNQDFRIQHLEHHIARASGEINLDEKRELETKIMSLTRIYEGKTVTYMSLATQLKQLQDDIRRKKREMDKIGAEKSDFTSKMEELNLHNEISQKELKVVIGMKQNTMVEDSIIKLEVKRLGGLLSKKADSVLSLEQKSQELNTAMKERKKEVAIHKDMLLGQMKTVEEERHTVSTELQDRLSRIDKLKNRYELLTVAMSPPEGDETQAFYIVKAAQEKEELQREGDAIDAKIQKAEKEIRALENTLQLLTNRNETYRKSFNKVSKSDEEFAKMEELEEKLRAVMDKYKHKRRQIRELQEDLQSMGVTMDVVVHDEVTFREMVQEKNSRVAQLKKDVDEQAKKAERVMKLISKTTQQIRTKKSVKEPTLEEKDIDLRCLRDRNRNMNNQIAQAVTQFPEISTSAEMYHNQAGLPGPSTMSDSAGSRNSSARSSVQSSPRSLQSRTKTPSRSQTSSSHSGVALGHSAK